MQFGGLAVYYAFIKIGFILGFNGLFVIDKLAHNNVLVCVNVLLDFHLLTSIQLLLEQVC